MLPYRQQAAREMRAPAINSTGAFRMLTTKALGVALGGSVAAVWSATLAADTAAPRTPTLSQAVAAQGAITWLLFLAAAMFGAATWIARPRYGSTVTVEVVEKESTRIAKAVIRAAGWGIAVVFLGLWRELHPYLIAFAVYIAGIVADLLTEAAIKLWTQVAANPMRAVRYFRAGRAIALEEDRDERRDERDRLDDTRSGRRFH